MRLWSRSTRVLAADDVVLAAHEALGWGGVVLPQVQMSGGVVHPVVSWRAGASARMSCGPEPMMSRAVLVAWEVDGPESAVRIVGFLHVGSPAAGIDRLKAVAAYGPGAMVVAAVARVGRWTMAEADVAGISVVEARCGGVRVALPGRRAPLPTARRSVATRLREEQLFDWALRAGVGPLSVPAMGIDEGRGCAQVVS